MNGSIVVPSDKVFPETSSLWMENTMGFLTTSQKQQHLSAHTLSHLRTLQHAVAEESWEPLGLPCH